jgi:Ran GTPase-activating protein (RanGAP) involved in mRNA processing and transport
MANNSLGDAGVAAFAAAVRHAVSEPATGCGLTSLSLSHNALGDAGCQALAAVLPLLPSLHRLYLPHNAISDAGVAALAGGCVHVHTLHLWHNRFGDGAVRALGDLLSAPRLQALHTGLNARTTAARVHVLRGRSRLGL